MLQCPKLLFFQIINQVPFFHPKNFKNVLTVGKIIPTLPVYQRPQNVSREIDGIGHKYHFIYLFNPSENFFSSVICLSHPQIVLLTMKCTLASGKLWSF